MGLVQLELRFERECQCIDRILKCQIECIPLGGYFVTVVVGVALTHDNVVYVLGFFHVGGTGFPEGGGALHVGVDYGDVSLGVGHVACAVDGGGT